MSESATNTTTPAPIPFYSSPMDIRVNRAELRKALERAARATDRKSSLPVLAHVAIQASHDGTVTITGTDLNITTSATLTNTFTVSGGGISVPAKALLDMVKRLPDAEISLRVTMRGQTSVIVVGSGNVSATLDGAHLRDYPKVSTAADLAWKQVNAATLSGMLGRVVHAACQDETRFHLNGVFLESNADSASVVATDGHRLVRASSRESAHSMPFTAGIIIPSRGVAEIRKLLGKSKDTCEVALSLSRMWVRHDGATLTIKLIDAQFPPYWQVIPTTNERIATVERAPLIAALERAKLVCTQTRGAKLTLGNGRLVIASDNADGGQSTETLPAGGIGAERDEAFSVGINATYVLELLAQISGDHVTMALDGAPMLANGAKGRDPQLSPILFRSTEDAVSHTVKESSFLGVIMPMRI